jgi:membrane fusion protein (multidrug efflux system)
VAASARERLASKAVNDAAIRAPFSGMVVERAVDLGEYVTVGHRIATLVEVDPLRLELFVPESASASVKQGNEVEFAVKAFPNERFKGQIRYVGPVLRQTTHDLVIEALVDNHDARLRPGMFAEAQLSVGEARLPLIPMSAFSSAGTTAHVFVVMGGVAEERVILLGPQYGDNVAVLEGLRPNERVILQPSEEIRDGVRVR